MLTQQVLDGFESAHIDAKLKATLRFLRKMTLEPRALAADDARAVLATLREAVSENELRELFSQLPEDVRRLFSPLAA